MSTLLISQQQGKGFVYFLPGRCPHAFIEFTVQFGIELKEVQSLHMQPLVNKSGYKIIRTRIGYHAVYLLPENFGLTQFIPLRQ